MTAEEMLYDVLSQMTPEQLKHQNPNVRSWYTTQEHQRANKKWGEELKARGGKILAAAKVTHSPEYNFGRDYD